MFLGFTWVRHGMILIVSLCFRHARGRFGHVSRYRQGQAVVVGVAKPQSVAYAALLLYRWLAAAPSDRNGSRTGLV